MAAPTLSKLNTWMHEGSTIIGLAGGAGAVTSVVSGALTWQQALGGVVFSAIAVALRQHPGTVITGNAGPVVVPGANPVVQTDTTIINTGATQP